jgi:hypothetical protein
VLAATHRGQGRIRRLLEKAVFLLTLWGFPLAAAVEPRARLEISPREATVGDPLEATLSVELPPGGRLERREIGPELGPFQVLSGTWEGPSDGGGFETWIWRGKVAAYETGTLQVPPIELALSSERGASTVRSEPLTVTIRSVLGAEAEGEPALADLKPPASVPPDYRAARRALATVGSLLGLLGLLWWGGRRLARRLAPVRADLDPFRRLPPHEWAYAELKRLLDERLADSAEVARLFDRLSSVLKKYLGARFRVNLLERTTEEVAPALRQVGVGEGCLGDVRRLLDLCDQVKFAGTRPALADCRRAIEAAYAIVDATRPVEEAAREKGAA